VAGVVIDVDSDPSTRGGVDMKLWRIEIATAFFKSLAMADDRAVNLYKFGAYTD
jgi:hypothetical protein